MLTGSAETPTSKHTVFWGEKPKKLMKCLLCCPQFVILLITSFTVSHCHVFHFKRNFLLITQNKCFALTCNSETQIIIGKATSGVPKWSSQTSVNMKMMYYNIMCHLQLINFMKRENYYQNGIFSVFLNTPPLLVYSIF